MGKLTDILAAQGPERQLSLDDLLALVEAENRDGGPQVIVAAVTIGADHGPIGVVEEAETGSDLHRGNGIPADDRDRSPSGNGLETGASVGHVDFADFRAVYVGPGRRPGIALVKMTAGWRGGSPPAWPVSVPYSKLTEV